MKRVTFMINRIIFLLICLTLSSNTITYGHTVTENTTSSISTNAVTCAFQFVDKHKDPKQVQALFDAARGTLKASTLGQDLAAALENSLYGFCTMKELWDLHIFRKNHKTILIKMPYLALALLHEFTEQIYFQINNTHQSIGQAFIDQIKATNTFLKLAFSTLFEQIKELYTKGPEGYIFHHDYYLSNSLKSHAIMTTTNIDTLLKALNYPKLRQFLHLLVQSQICNLTKNIPDQTLQKVLSEDNIIATFDNAVQKTLSIVLTPEEVTALTTLIGLPAFQKIMSNSAYIVNQLNTIITPVISSMHLVSETTNYPMTNGNVSSLAAAAA